ncbi:hypothetical protein CVT25_001982 [Psilocybe cyanescens]|uniref:Uncharacterized protein n=1 Tax=Psilocybe cyanescens TaxID=93625 RepID=A0A409X9B9_PSICY|nr:hypothetical protein CVT25_001982 [Psilocybe cyanescens]
MIPLYILSTVASTVVIQKIFYQAKTDNLIRAVAIPGGNFCILSSNQRYAYAFWIPTFAFECFLCSLAVMRGLRHFSFRGSYRSISVNLVNMLVQDSILYFIAQVFQLLTQCSIRQFTSTCSTGATYLICMGIWIVDPYRGYLPDLYGYLDSGPGKPIQ